MLGLCHPPAMQLAPGGAGVGNKASWVVEGQLVFESVYDVGVGPKH